MHDFLLQDLRFWIPVFFLLIFWAVMQAKGLTPSMYSIHEFIALLNTRGGNIALLSMGSIYFFKWSMYLFMTIIRHVQDGTLKDNNPIVLLAVQFATTIAFGNFSGALIKTMTGDSGRGRPGDTPPLNGSGKSQSSTTITTTTENREAKLEPSPGSPAPAAAVDPQPPVQP